MIRFRSIKIPSTESTHQKGDVHNAYWMLWVNSTSFLCTRQILDNNRGESLFSFRIDNFIFGDLDSIQQRTVGTKQIKWNKTTWNNEIDSHNIADMIPRRWKKRWFVIIVIIYYCFFFLSLVCDVRMRCKRRHAALNERIHTAHKPMLRKHARTRSWPVGYEIHSTHEDIDNKDNIH